MAETPEDFIGPNDHSQIVKGKRTKRQRLSSPFGMTSSSSSGGASSGGASSGGGGGERDHYSLIPSPATSISEISTEEEEDMANCLILLAQGCGPGENEEDGGGKVDRLSTRKFSDMASTGKAAGGFYVYACKTCNRTFPSFQALGGHRASHKRPKLSMVEEKKTPVAPPPARTDKYEEEEEGQFNKISPTTLSIHVASSNKSSNVVNKANKVHECSICGSEFSSGQALGGHMRRHRSTSTTNIHNQIAMNMDTIISTSCSQSQDTEKPRNILPLDLNLPAPEDDHHHRDSSKFQFTSKQQGLVFSAPALVDCHY